MIVGAKKNLRRAFEIFDSLVRMTRAQLARPFVTHRWIIADESPHAGCGGNEVDADPTAHAVAHHRAPFRIDIASGLQIAPCAVDNLDKLPITRFFLSFMHTIRFTEHLVQIRHDRRVTEPGEIADGGFHVAGDTVVMMNDKYAGAGRFAIRVRYVARDAVFLWRKIS